MAKKEPTNWKNVHIAPEVVKRWKKAEIQLENLKQGIPYNWLPEEGELAAIRYQNDGLLVYFYTRPVTDPQHIRRWFRASENEPLLWLPVTNPA